MTHTTRARLAALTLVVLGSLVLGACGDSEDGAGSNDTEQSGSKSSTTSDESSAAGEQTDKVAVKGFRFQPQAIRVAKGTTVTWSFEDEAAHSVISRTDGAFKSEDLKKGESFEHTFEEAGTFEYFCGIHNSMTGTVTVG